MILYRPVGLQELELIYDSGMKAFPARLPKQPIFYPVLDVEYARQTAAGWNAKSGQSAGYVTQFKVEDEYIQRFEKHTVGNSQHEEYWIPAEEVEEFNKHILGHIKVIEGHFGKKFEGFVPDKFGLQGQNAVEQFTLLANSYIYKRMDFYLEIKRNHKAVFLNFPFWQKHEFKNPGLKGKVLQAIKEGWLTAFPNNPLTTIDNASALPAKSSSSQPIEDTVEERTTAVKPVDIKSLARPREESAPIVKRSNVQPLRPVIRRDSTPAKPIPAPSLRNTPDEEEILVEPEELDSFDEPVEEAARGATQTESPSFLKEEVEAEGTNDFISAAPPPQADIPRFRPAGLQPPTRPVPAENPPAKQRISHFAQGVELALGGDVHGAVESLTRAVQDDPRQVVAHTSLGVAFHRLGEDDRALGCFEEALRVDPNNAEAHYFRANLLYGQGNVREAVSGYTIAIGQQPDLIEVHRTPAPQNRLTDFRPLPAETHRIARRAQRILSLNQAIEASPRQANLLKERAAEYYRLWNYEQAIADYTASLAIQPEDADALHLRGVAYEQIGQFDRARQDYRRAVAVDPQLGNTYIERGIAFGNAGNFRQSVASLNEGIRLAPANADAYFNRGASYVQLGDFQNAMEDFSIVIQLSPDDEAAYYWRGYCHEEAGRKEDAIADYRQFLTLSQDPQARQEIEQKLKQWNVHKSDRGNNRGSRPGEQQKPDQIHDEEPQWTPDLYDLIVALGERALSSTWMGRDVDCFGEKADELYAFVDQNRPIPGQDLLHITSGIRQTIAGDFRAVDPGATAHWILIRAWDGNGFYVEIDDPKSKERLKTHFHTVEDVEGASPPYESLFIPI